MKKPHFNVCITCVGGRLIYDMINAIRDSDDYTITVIGIDVNPDAHGRLLCDYFSWNIRDIVYISNTN